MNFKDIPLTWLSCIFVGLAMLMTYYDLNGFAHTMLGFVSAYYFQKAVFYDKKSGRIK